MKYHVQVMGEAALGLAEQDFDLDAPDANQAVDFARTRLEALLPLEGGALDVVVSCSEEYSTIVRKPAGGTITETHPPGVVSEFSVKFEPHESVRAKLEKDAEEAAAAQAKQAEHDEVRLELLGKLLAEGKITQQVFDGLAGKEEVTK